MPRLLPWLAGMVALLALIPAAASAQIIEIGQTTDRPAASCPADPCVAMTRLSGFQVTTQGRSKAGMMVAPRDGRVVAFTIRLGNPSAQQIAFFNSNFGGAAQARISILKPPRKGYSYQLTGQSELFALRPYFNRETQFALLRSLFVRKGYIVALTTPTWAPALASGLDDGNAWRTSRAQTACADQPPPQAAQQRLGSLRDYRCLYRKERMLYRATMVVTPRKNATS
jgi:hypothetical protein